MQKIIWDKRYNIDNGIIDKQHQYLVKLINLIADETGIYVEKLRQWLFSYSNKNYTFYDFHKKRGKEAMDDIGFMENL